MRFSEEYIEICRRLDEIHPRADNEWQPGDWIWFGGDVLVIHRNVDASTEMGVCFGGLSLVFDPIKDKKEVFWIPGSPADWMAMEALLDDHGGHYQLYPFQTKDGLYWSVEHEAKTITGDRGTIYTIAQDPDPLLACAKAWQQALEAGA